MTCGGKIVVLVVLLGACGLAMAAQAAPGNATRKTTARPKAASTADASVQLRKEWDLPELKLTREAVEDTTFPPDIKRAASAAVDWFILQQEGLLAEVAASPKAEAKARATRPQLEAQFKRKMSSVYDNPKLMAELGRCLKALNKEMDDMAASSDKMFANLSTVGLSAAQKAKLAPLVQQANARLKKVVDKSPTKSTKDSVTREEVVKSYKEARAQVRQQLTPEQKAKLNKKLADDAQ